MKKIKIGEVTKKRVRNITIFISCTGLIFFAGYLLFHFLAGVVAIAKAADVVKITNFHGNIFLVGILGILIHGIRLRLKLAPPQWKHYFCAVILACIIPILQFFVVSYSGYHLCISDSRREVISLYAYNRSECHLHRGYH